MTKADFTPFPPHIDRDAFGYWLSGFTDGEGCFALGTQHTRRPVSPTFCIGLRADDRPALELIRSYWQCGAVRTYRCTPENNPRSDFCVWNTRQMADIVVRHFDRYPLRSKKARDFVIWREAVLILADGLSRKVQHVKGVWGCQPKWTDQERQHLRGLAARMKAMRAYKSVP